MKKSINTWKVIERIAEEVQDGLDNEEYDVVASLLWDLAFRTAMYAVKKKGFNLRRTWPNVKKFLPSLSPPLKEDYTDTLASAKEINKEARYSEDEWEYDPDLIEDVAKKVLRFVDDVSEMA